MSDPKLIDLAVEIRHETAKAYLVHDGIRDVWLPKSMCEVEWKDGAGTADKDDIPVGRGIAIITLPEWLAKKSELI